MTLNNEFMGFDMLVTHSFFLYWYHLNFQVPFLAINLVILLVESAQVLVLCSLNLDYALHKILKYEF